MGSGVSSRGLTFLPHFSLAVLHGPTCLTSLGMWVRTKSETQFQHTELQNSLNISDIKVYVYQRHSYQKPKEKSLRIFGRLSPTSEINGQENF